MVHVCVSVQSEDMRTTTKYTHIKQTRYLSVEVPVFTAALPASTSPRFLHLHLLWVLQLQGLQLLNDPRAAAGTHVVALDQWGSFSFQEALGVVCADVTEGLLQEVLLAFVITRSRFTFNTSITLGM